MKLNRLIEARSETYDMQRQIFDEYHLKASKMIDSMR
jgi:hypothetical protein